MTQPPKRILAAVMFTDIVGYTAMMQENETRAIALRERHKNVLQQSVRECHGEILQYYGDGTLCIFQSSIECVSCALKIQQNFIKEPKIPLRIGIHVGDIVYNSEEVFGDGVNIASRVESLATASSILISDKVYDDVKNHPEFQTCSLGYFKLKNVTREVEIFALTNEGLAVPSNEDLKTKHHSSIAVLPFVNMSNDKDNEYFADGITEEIINSLVKVDGLKVTSRTSSFAFKGKNIDIRSIGKELNVHTVLEGSVRKHGSRIRVTAQLINTSDGYHIFSETFNRDLEDIFEIQDEISVKISHLLREKLSLQSEPQTLVETQTKNIKAYNTYLKGRFYFNKWTPDNAKKACRCFEDAINMEPDFVLPYMGLANCYTYLGTLGYMPDDAAYEKARKVANQAMKLDPDSYGPYLSLAMIKLFNDWDLEEAKKLFDKALELQPGASDIHHYYAVYLLATGKTDQAIKELEIASELDPLSSSIANSLGDAYFAAKKYDKAIEQYDKTLELDPVFRNALQNKGWVFAMQGNLEEAIDVFKKVYEQTPGNNKGLTGLGYAYAVTGNTNAALKILNQLENRAEVEKEVSLDMDFAILYLGLNDMDNTFYYLEKAYKKKKVSHFLYTHPLWEKVRKDPRYQKMINKYGHVKPVSE